MKFTSRYVMKEVESVCTAHSRVDSLLDISTL
jgi:hypothetical protein